MGVINYSNLFPDLFVHKTLHTPVAIIFLVRIAEKILSSTAAYVPSTWFLLLLLLSVAVQSIPSTLRLLSSHVTPLAVLCPDITGNSFEAMKTSNLKKTKSPYLKSQVGGKCAPSRTRTDTVRILSPLPLPIGL